MFSFQPDASNVMPTRYRHVALAKDLPSLDRGFLRDHFIGKEAYFRTRFIVAESGGRHALLEVLHEEGPELFSPITDMRCLAGPAECVYVCSEKADAGVPSHLAEVAALHPNARCTIIEGRYAHVSFILNPTPLKLYVLDIVPPHPSKLLDQVTRVLDVAEDLPPVVIVPILIDSQEQLAKDRSDTPDTILVPCRGAGLAIPGAEIAYLDERPKQQNWTLLGCERSHQIHNWFYGTSPDTVDICPKRFIPELDATDGALLTRCCLLQEGIEAREEAMFVPWGASLDEVREAIATLIKSRRVPWTRI